MDYSSPNYLALEVNSVIHLLFILSLHLISFTMVLNLHEGNLKELVIWADKSNICNFCNVIAVFSCYTQYHAPP